MFFSDDGKEPDLQGFYNENVALGITDPRNIHGKAYWQDYGANIFADKPPGTKGGGAVLGTVDNPPGKIVLGYDKRVIKSLSNIEVFYIYSGPRYATGPIRMYVNADVDLTAGKGIRTALGSEDAPMFAPFVVRSLYKGQGGAVGALQVQVSDGSVRNVQVFSQPPKVRPH